MNSSREGAVQTNVRGRNSVFAYKQASRGKVVEAMPHRVTAGLRGWR